MSSNILDRQPPAVVGRDRRIRSGLHPVARPIVLTILNLAIHALLLFWASGFIGNELGAVSKASDGTTTTLVGHLAFKIAVIGFGWWTSLDYVEVAAVTALANTPFYYLLTTYYAVSPSTVATTLVIELFAIAFPTYLLQTHSAAHDRRIKIRNRYLLESFQVQHSTNLVSIGIYTFLIWAGLTTGKLNEWIIVWFTNVPTLETAHKETVVSIAVKVFAAGLATKTFLVNASIAAETDPATPIPVEAFNPATADLGSTLRHNFWFYKKRTRSFIRNTVILCIITFVNTVQRSTTLKESSPSGAAKYGGLWVGAIVVNAIVLACTLGDEF
ncbi:hypothetical protein B0J11DRAFT_426322 [Dendryphion nanum]|uniref:Uncharacterized protein n=1 Tax=Dendryphion nanum TaxID=256645 RepID=A0A9P9EB26_9PLEO|nr:hypothetical protein B0J11DRAFT_426322 [Dendryphion nanum]